MQISARTITRKRRGSLSTREVVYMRDISSGIAGGIDPMRDGTAAVEPGVIDVDGGVCPIGVDVRGAVMDRHIDMVEVTRGGIGLGKLVGSMRVGRRCKVTHNIDSCVEAVETGKKKIGSIPRFDNVDVRQGQFGIISSNDDAGVVGGG